METKTIKINIGRLIFDYFSTVEKLFGTWKKAVPNLIMVTGFFLISVICLVSFEAVAYYINNVPISQFNAFIFGSILAPLLSLIIIFQISSILLGLLLKGNKKMGTNLKRKYTVD
jgi:hypothetical protein